MSDFHYPGGFVYKGVTYAGVQLEDSIKKIESDLVLDPSDVIIATYPKSGTTWMEEVLYSVDVGPEKARKRTECMANLIRFIEMRTGSETEPTQYVQFTTSPPPRRIKTHLYASFFERFLTNTQGPKFIVVVRNPKDTLVSYYHFHRMVRPLGFLERPWEDFFQVYKEKRLMFGDVFDFNLSWWKVADHPNVLFLHFEDMLSDLDKAVRQVADFVGRTLTEEEVNMIVHDASFSQMKLRGHASYLRDANMYVEKVSPFFRAGEKDVWHDLINDEQNAYIDEQARITSEPHGIFYKY